MAYISMSNIIFEYGFTDYLVKPVTREKLTKTIEKLVANS
jgi:two-component SAPR family response regulator